jgi:hypothetical protein
MNLFDVFPQLGHEQTSVLQGRSLRLIALSGIVFDEQAFYFELSEQRFWGRLPNGGVSIGIGAAKVRPDAAQPPHQALVQHLRRQWRCEVDFHPSGHAYVLGDDSQVVVLTDVAVSTPYIFILTAPQLGGAEMPDALVQAVYLMPVRRWRGKSQQSLLQIQRDALDKFLEPADWPFGALQAESWASLHNANEIPDDARVRPILALRGLQDLLRAEVLPNQLFFSSARE